MMLPTLRTKISGGFGFVLSELLTRLFIIIFFFLMHHAFQCHFHYRLNYKKNLFVLTNTDFTFFSIELAEG